MSDYKLIKTSELENVIAELKAVSHISPTALTAADVLETVIKKSTPLPSDAEQAAKEYAENEFPVGEGIVTMQSVMREIARNGFLAGYASAQGKEKEWAKKILNAKDALIKNDYTEAFYQLYSIASPNFD